MRGVVLSLLLLGCHGGGERRYQDGALVLDWGPFEVPAGSEGTRCVVKRLNNREPIQVSAIENHLSQFGHHLIVYRVSDAEERPEPFPCQPFADSLRPDKGAPLMITQRKAELLELPAGVAFTMAAEQMIRLELHYLNASDQSGPVEATSRFTPVPAGEIADQADFLFMGNADIKLPPRVKTTLGPTYFRLPAELEGANFFAITGHQHQWGTDVRVAVTDGPDGQDQSVYAVEKFLWDEPETVRHHPPFQVPSAGGFRFACDWTNLSERVVGFGQRADQEMCFFWAYYYPSAGARVCLQSAKQMGGFDLCCPGDSLCGLVE